MIAESDTVRVLDLGVAPEVGAPMPVLLSDDIRTIVMFYAVNRSSDGAGEDAGIAIVEFESCALTKFGYPNDEALPGHPLYDRGLGRYGCYEVLNPTWAAEIDAMNRVSFPEYQLDPVRHFIFTFHDSTFECLAEGLEVAVVDSTWNSVVAAVATQLIRSGESSLLGRVVEELATNAGGSV
ncbi:MAG: hypothetical protein R3A46_16850 [Thermomicrobiales bacterium]